MSYSDVFAEILTGQGIPLDADTVPDQQSVESDLERLRDWLSSLEDDTRAAIDQVTAANPIQAGLADESVGIVRSIGTVLSAFDNQPNELSISNTLEILTAASHKAALGEA